jgi:hypothetical protein
MTPIESAVYDKCQRLAKEASVAEEKAWRKDHPIGNMPAEICNMALFWTTAADFFFRGKIDEEEIKSYFHLGFVPEYSDVFDEVNKQVKNKKILNSFSKKNKKDYFFYYID